MHVALLLSLDTGRATWKRLSEGAVLEERVPVRSEDTRDPYTRRSAAGVGSLGSTPRITRAAFFATVFAASLVVGVEELTLLSGEHALHPKQHQRTRLS